MYLLTQYSDPYFCMVDMARVWLRRMKIETMPENRPSSYFQRGQILVHKSYRQCYGRSVTSVKEQMAL